MVSSMVSTVDKAQFNYLVSTTYKKVFAFAFRLSGQRSEAEDLTQEAFVRAYRAFDSYEGHRPFENWIYRILTRLFLDYRRKRGRRVQTVSFDSPIRLETGDEEVRFDSADPSPTPEGSLFEGTVSEEMEESLRKLTDEQRLLVWLADVEGVPYKELAEMTGTPIGTVRSRLHRAHKQLKRYLDQAQQRRLANSQASA